MPETLNKFKGSKDVLKIDEMPIGEIVDFFTEWNFNRGSPHIHTLFWVKDAPQYEQSANEEIIHFVDKYITCKNDQSDEMRELVNLQTHRNAKTCKKGGHKIILFVDLISLFLQCQGL